MVFFAHWLHGRLTGRTFAPLELSEALRTLHVGELTLGFLLAALALGATFLFGRYFCGWGCHLLALQDLASEGLARLGWRWEPPRWRVLRLVPWALVAWLILWPLAMRGWASITIVEDGFWTADPWRNLPGPGLGLLTLVVSGPVLVAALGPRSFCRDVCPYGALFGVAERLAPVRLVLGPGCTDCGACDRACRSNVDVLGWLKTEGAVRDPACIRDLDCVAACPTAAIRVDRAPVRIVHRPRAGAPWFEEVAVGGLTVVSFLAFAGLYDSVPVLLAAALAVLVSTSIVRLLSPTPGRIALAALAVVALAIAVPRRLAERDAELAWRMGAPDALPRLEALAHGIYTSPALHQRLASLYLADERLPEARAHLQAAIAGGADPSVARVLAEIDGGR
jgi:ferredoxin